ncbi:serine/threonine-protein kinase Nek11 isoform X1, partial [Tachysurus ichikawai]
MLERSPSLRVSAAEALSTDVIKELTQHLKQRLSEETAVDDRGVSHIASVLQKKVHLQTLRERSEVEKMSPRERMRLRKQQAADERARKLKHIVEEKYKENQQRMMELRCKNFQRLSINVLTEKAEDTVRQIQPIRQQKVSLSSRPGPMGERLTEH